MKNKRGQVWVETVVYTLIGLTLIGVVLAFITPKINEYKDRSVIEETISSLNKLDEKISEVLDAPGNKRKIEFRMLRGEIYFDGVEDSIYYTLNDSRAIFSEPGVPTSIGKIQILSQKGNKENSVLLSLNYSLNITVDSVDKVRKFSSASTPYNFFVENKGFSQSGQQIIDVTEISS